MVIGSIPWAKMRAYLIEELDLDGEEYDRVYEILRRVDGEYIGLVNRSGRDHEDMATIVKPDDSEGIKNMMRRLGSRHKQGQPKTE